MCKKIIAYIGYILHHLTAIFLQLNIPLLRDKGGLKNSKGRHKNLKRSKKAVA